MNPTRREQIRRALLRQLAPVGAISEEKKQPGRTGEEKQMIEEAMNEVEQGEETSIGERVRHRHEEKTPFVGAVGGLANPPVPQPIPTTPVPAPRTTIEQAVNVFQGAQPIVPIPEPVGGVAQISAGEEEKKYPQPDNQTDSTTGLQMLSTPLVGVAEEVKSGEEESEEMYELSEEEVRGVLNAKGKNIHLPKLLTKHGVYGLYKKLTKHPELYEQHFGTETYEHLMSILKASVVSGLPLGKTAKKSVERMLGYDKEVRAKRHTTRKQVIPSSSSTTLPLVGHQEKAPEPPPLEVADDNATDAEKERIATANAQKMAEYNLAMVVYEAQHASEMDELKKRNEMVQQGITNYEIQSNIINAGKKSELQEKIDKLNVKTEIKESIGSALQGQPQLGIGEKKIIPPYKALDLKQNTSGGVVFDRVYQDANRQQDRDFRRGELILQKIPRLKQVDKILNKVEKESEKKILTQQPRDIYRVSVWERILRRFPSQGVPIPRPEKDHNYGHEERRIPIGYDSGVGHRGYYRFPDALDDETANTFLIC
jgi:hypothetical protein